MRNIFRKYCFLLLTCLLAMHAISQGKKQRIIVDNGKRYAYSDSAGVTDSYIGYFGDRFIVPDLTTIDGKTITAESIKGKTVVYNCWFVSCRPCVAEIPALNKMVRKYQSDSIVFIGISFDKVNQIETFQDKHQFLFQLISMPQAEIAQIKKVELYPFTAIVNKEGRLTFVLFGRPIGNHPEEEIFDLLDKQLSKAVR